jgi:hypothetical protein
MGKHGKTTLPFKLDFNFYPEREDEAHRTLMQIFNEHGDYLANLSLAKAIRLIVDTKLLLWDTLYEVDTETGEFHARRWRRS